MNSDNFSSVSTTSDQDADDKKKVKSPNLVDSMDNSKMDSTLLPNTSPTDMTDLKRKPRVKDEKICRVCGDKALGYNFNAMTCESCKAFFRRNAAKGKMLKCLFQGDCQVDVRTRRFCPACRLIKCLDAGMKKEMILDDTERRASKNAEDDTERRARMQKVLENRKKKVPHTEDGGDLDLVKEEPLSDSDMMPDQSCQDPLPPLSSQAVSSQSALAAGLQSELPYDYHMLKTPELVHSNSSTKDPSKYRILSLEETVLFQELGEVYKTTLGELILAKNDDTFNNCTDLINNSEVAVRRLITFFKHLEDFQKVSHDDQIAALKACVLSAILLRSAYFFDPDKNTWSTLNGEVSSSVLKKSTGYGEIHDIHTDFCRKIKEMIGSDTTVFALIQLICSFNPEGKDIKCPAQISNIQDKYIVLLKHYLESEFSYSLGQTLFVKLMMMLLDMRKVADFHNEIVLKANPREIAPLMLEVLDLK